ncbi:unnamed protein product [Auanema sp. JU1783]|nr:unnamed protein product [Auanema sp. JU1783]
MASRPQSTHELQTKTLDVSVEIKNNLMTLTGNTSKDAKEAAILYFRQIFSGEEQNFEFFLDYEILIKSLLKYMQSQISFIETEEKDNMRLLDAAWIITNISCISNEQCHVIVENDAIKILFDVALNSPRSSQLRAQAIWALGNIAADCQVCKLDCRTIPILELLADILMSKEYGRDAQVVRNIVWCSLNIIRGGIPNLSLVVVMELVRGCFETIKLFPQNTVITKDCLWTIAALADDMNSGRHIEVVTNQPNLINYIFTLFHQDNVSYMHGCLRILGNIATGNDRQTETVLSHPLFYETILKALDSPLKYLNREAAWICSNVAAGNFEHVDSLFEDNLILKHIMRGASDEITDSKMQKECLWTIANMLTAASRERSSFLIAAGIITVFPYLLQSKDIRIVERSVSCLRMIITDHPHYIGYVMRTKMLERIEDVFLEMDQNLRTSKEHITILMKDYTCKPALPAHTFRLIRS